MSKDKKKLSVATATRRRIETLYPKSPSGKASDYIKHFQALAQTQTILSVILFARVSGRNQDYKGNLDAQMASLRQAVQPHEIIAEFRAIESGWKDAQGRLQGAVEMASQTGAIIVTESTDRFIRNIDYHSKNNPSTQPNVAEYERLNQIAGGVTLATVQHPDTSWKKIRSYQSKRGQKAKNNSGGRPIKVQPGYKKKQRGKKLPEVIRLHRGGKTVSQISTLTRTPPSTVKDWISKYCV
ncbi:MAG: hypothetical protein A2Y12_04665 [Planctomycetes bacterium GWF2_42_9]|nr:MAG: hypothetical protein A2Y12_04665 [Planctomycetes bacterium GWF2_42_9]